MSQVIPLCCSSAILFHPIQKHKKFLFAHNFTPAAIHSAWRKVMFNIKNTKTSRHKQQTNWC